MNMAKIMYPVVYFGVWLCSLLPLRVLYLFADLMYVMVYRLVKYRRKVVRDNLEHSFPEKNKEELRRIEKEFYAFFCDYLVETIKLCSISDKELRRRMQFVGVEEMVKASEREGKLFVFIYLAHYGNWEWVSSLSARVREAGPDITGGHVYHPLRSKVFNRLFLYLRARFEGENIPMKETLRFIFRQRQAKKRTIIGFIADQNPKWSSIHHWTMFLHRMTPVFIGTERIGKQVDALIYYAQVERIRRGYYRCTLTRMVDDVCRYPDYEVTDRYFQLLEQTIQARPALWLWTHKRWKRTYEAYMERNAEAATTPHTSA